jgi:hypothetical protein
MLLKRKVFSQNIGNVLTSWNVRNGNGICVDTFMNKMMLDVNVFGSLVMDRIRHKISRTFVIDRDGKRIGEVETNLQ